MGYKTCRVLNSSLDATVCAEDCDRLEKEDFATNCKDKGGLYNRVFQKTLKKRNNNKPPHIRMGVIV